MSARPPTGLRLLALGAAIFACTMVLGVLAAESTMMGGPAGLLGVLAAVAAEALWHGRPWAFRASVLLAMAYFVVVLASPALIPAQALFAVAFLFLSGGFVIAALFYIRRQIAALAQASSQTPKAAPGRVP